MMNKYEEALFRQKQLFCPHCLPEKTCDKCNLSKDFKALHELIDKYETLENAMDKAVWCIVNNIDFLKNTKKSEEEWKEWFKEKWY